MAYSNFVDALMTAKRRAQLQGRPLSQQEATGIGEGFARSAADKNLQEQGLTLQEKGLTESSRQFSEQLAQRKYETELERKTAEEAQKNEKMEKMAGAAAGLAGGVVGGVFGGPIGAAVGAGVGSSVGPGMYQLDPLKGVAKGLFGGCIIISACTSPESLEVSIAREYRNRFMDEEILTGYYLICPAVVRWIQKYPAFKAMVKKILVDRLVDFGAWRMGRTTRRSLWGAYAVTIAFLALCRALGRGTNLILEAHHGE